MGQVGQSKWIRTKYTGVRYREHTTRKVGGRPDRYFSIRLKHAGVLREEALGWASEGWTVQQAAALLAEIKRNVRSGEGPQSLAEKRAHIQEQRQADSRQSLIAERDALTFDQAAERFIEWAQHNKRSWKDDRERYTLHLKPEIGHLPLTKISNLTIERLKNTLTHKRIRVGHPDERVMAPATVTQVLTLARKIFNYASQTPMREDTPDLLMFVGRNPAKGVKVQRFDNTRYRILDPADDERLFEGSARDQDLHDCILLSLATGMRRGEICALRKEDCLQLDSGRIRAVDTKNGESRTVFPDERSLAMLRRRLSENPESPYVFPGRLAGHLNKDHITRRFDELADELGINAGVTDRRGRITFHSLRHTFGTRQIMAGMDVLTLKKLMGHRLLSTTERYVHLAEEHLHRQALDAARNSGKLVDLKAWERK